MIELREISKEYKSKAGNVLALDNVNLILPEKGMIFILGKSGCGKSTMLNILGGLDSPTGGSLIIDEKHIDNYREKALDSYRNKQLGSYSKSTI